MKFGKKEIIGIVFGVVVILISVIFLRGEKIFWFINGIAIVVMFLPFIVSATLETKKEGENNEMFLEFTRDLVESARSGTPISKSIINVKDKEYGSLSPHVEKLGNQIALGIPVSDALRVFADDIGSQMIMRSVNLISQAETAGGEIYKILESVAGSVSEIEKLKKERKASIYNLVVQGYIIFIVFIAIMLVIEFKILTMTMDLGDTGGLQGVGSFGGLGAQQVDPSTLSNAFTFLLLAQGLFAGLTIGKLAEGSIKAGIKHSFILMVITILVVTGARAFLT